MLLKDSSYIHFKEMLRWTQNRRRILILIIALPLTIWSLFMLNGHSNEVLVNVINRQIVQPTSYEVTTKTSTVDLYQMSDYLAHAKEIPEMDAAPCVLVRNQGLRAETKKQFYMCLHSPRDFISDEIRKSGK